MVKSKGSGFTRLRGKSVETSTGIKTKIAKDIEKRADIRRMFIDELGFKEVFGTNNMSPAQLGAIAIELKKHEAKTHTLRDNNVIFSTMHNATAYGAASDMGGGKMALFINPKYHANVGEHRAMLRAEQKAGFKAKTNGTPTKDYTYTARHEYGHLTQFSITNKTGKDAAQIRSEVRAIAAKRYGATKSLDPSRYGGYNKYEYFSESYASMTGGRPNAHGKALKAWMKENGL